MSGEDRIDEFFADLLPGTTPGRSRKALRRVQSGASQPDPVDDDADGYAPTDEWLRLGRTVRVFTVDIEMFPIRALGLAWDNRSSKTVHRAEASRMLPPPNIHAPTNAPPPPGKDSAVGERLYFDHQIEAVVRVTQELGCYERHVRTTASQRESVRRRLLETWTPAWLASEIEKQRRRTTP